MSQCDTKAPGMPAISLPNINISGLALIPIYIGSGILSLIMLLGLLFGISKLFGYTYVFDWWAVFIRVSFIALVISLAAINGSYTGILKNMSMCTETVKNFINTATSLLAAITILLWYIVSYNFDRSDTTENYLLIMLHINILASLLTLCLTTMQKLSLLNKSIV